MRTCEARYRKRGKKCGVTSNSVRRIAAAPGLWVNIPLCKMHQDIWDQAPRDFKIEPQIQREKG